MGSSINDEILTLLGSDETKHRGFELLVRHYSEKLYWQVRRIVLSHDDSNDIVQNALLKAWLNIGDFEKRSHIYTWLSRIAINEALDFVRKKNKLAVSSDDDLSVANQLLADEYFDGDKTEALLQQAIAKLPEVQRAVFTLRYYEELKYSEISSILGTSEGALKASYHIAAKKIEDFFRRHD